MTLLPLTRALILDADTPVSAFAKLHRGPFGFLLESMEGGERWARYTFMATEPKVVFRYRGRTRERWAAESGWMLDATDEAPLDHIGALMRQYPPVEVPGLPRFTGGAVGFLGYDVVRTLEKLPPAPADDRDLPDAIMMVAETILVLDNRYNRATVIHNVELPPYGGGAERRASIARGEVLIDDWIQRLKQPATLGPLPAGGDATRRPIPGGCIAISGRSIRRPIFSFFTWTTSTCSAAHPRFSCGSRDGRSPSAPSRGPDPGARRRRRTVSSRRSSARTPRSGRNTSCWWTWAATMSVASRSTARSE